MWRRPRNGRTMQIRFRKSNLPSASHDMTIAGACSSTGFGFDRARSPPGGVLQLGRRGEPGQVHPHRLIRHGRDPGDRPHLRLQHPPRTQTLSQQRKLSQAPGDPPALPGRRHRHPQPPAHPVRTRQHPHWAQASRASNSAISRSSTASPAATRPAQPASPSTSASSDNPATSTVMTRTLTTTSDSSGAQELLQTEEVATS